MFYGEIQWRARINVSGELQVGLFSAMSIEDYHGPPVFNNLRLLLLFTSVINMA